MGTCNSCKFWETSKEGKGVCQHKLVGGHKHSNQSDAYTPHEDKIYTGPLFGCVHYDTKD